MKHIAKLSSLAFGGGLLAALVVLLFRLLFEQGVTLVQEVEMSLLDSRWSSVWMLVVPLAGALALIGLARVTRVDGRAVGVTHVIARLRRGSSLLPVRHAAMQFGGGILAMSAGFSGGPQGPAMHLGATCASQFATLLKLDEEDARTLLGAGMAAALAAVFGTSLAAVFVVLEVVFLDFRLRQVIPITVGMAAGKSLTLLLGGPVFEILPHSLDVDVLQTLAFAVPLGVVIGVLAASFNYAIELASKIRLRAFWQRALIAGALTAACGLFVPSALGIGTDTFAGLLSGTAQFALGFCVTFIVVKLLLTTATIGLGIPLGIIAPSLVLGAMVGYGATLVGTELFGEFDHLDPTIYILLGATGMFAAILNCPISALIVVLELSAQPRLLLPAVLVVVTANLTATGIFGRQSVFEARLAAMSETDTEPRVTTQT